MDRFFKKCEMKLSLMWWFFVFIVTQKCSVSIDTKFWFYLIEATTQTAIFCELLLNCNSEFCLWSWGALNVTASDKLNSFRWVLGFLYFLIVVIFDFEPRHFGQFMIQNVPFFVQMQIRASFVFLVIKCSFECWINFGICLCYSFVE